MSMLVVLYKTLVKAHIEYTKYALSRLMHPTLSLYFAATFLIGNNPEVHNEIIFSLINLISKEPKMI